MNIYMAGRYSQQEQFRTLRTKIESLGHRVVSRWIDSKHPYHPGEGISRQVAHEDIHDLLKSDLVIIDATESAGEGGCGREFEFGFTLGSPGRRLVWLVGEPRGVFHHLVNDKHPDWDSVLNSLVRIK